MDNKKKKSRGLNPPMPTVSPPMPPSKTQPSLSPLQERTALTVPSNTKSPISDLFVDILIEDTVRIPLKRLEELIRADTIYKTACVAYTRFDRNYELENIWDVLFGPRPPKGDGGNA
jgi:hypothetical protein